MTHKLDNCKANNPLVYLGIHIVHIEYIHSLHLWLHTTLSNKEHVYMDVHV